ncbi:MAG: hypothetical protein CL608_19220 [Anaerolineaceae bacterium]|nr:hypothetical protein [Anaerolineaceae bacterium]
MKTHKFCNDTTSLAVAGVLTVPPNRLGLESSRSTCIGIKFLLAVLCFAVLLSACTGSSAVSAGVLEGQTWVLAKFNGGEPLEGRQPTLEFEAGKVSGNTGCNHYGGSYQIEDESIRFEDLFSTEMACLDPEGLMAQEQDYLGLLRAVNHFELVDDVLTLITDAGQNLVFEIQQEISEELMSTLDPTTPTPTVEVIAPTPTPTFTPPIGFKEYQDSVAGVSLYIPETWAVTSVMPGQSAIIQSYPTDKYIGGEMREPGDTKCDLSIRPEGDRAEDLIQQWRSDSMTTIAAEESFALQNGLTGQRFVIDSMGRATVFLTEINQRVVLLTCFGDFTQVDAMATTLNKLE